MGEKRRHCYTAEACALRNARAKREKLQQDHLSVEAAYRRSLSSLLVDEKEKAARLYPNVEYMAHPVRRVLSAILTVRCRLTYPHSGDSHIDFIIDMCLEYLAGGWCATHNRMFLSSHCVYCLPGAYNVGQHGYEIPLLPVSEPFSAQPLSSTPDSDAVSSSSSSAYSASSSSSSSSTSLSSVSVAEPLTFTYDPPARPVPLDHATHVLRGALTRVASKCCFQSGVPWRSTQQWSLFWIHDDEDQSVFQEWRQASPCPDYDQHPTHCPAQNRLPYPRDHLIHLPANPTDAPLYPSGTLFRLSAVIDGRGRSGRPHYRFMMQATT